MPPQTPNSQYLLDLSADLAIVFLSILAFQTVLIYRQWKTLKTREYKSYFFYLIVTLVYFSLLWAWALQPCKLDAFIDFIEFHFKRPLAFLIYYLYYDFVVDFLDFKLIAPKIFKAIAIVKKGLLLVICFFIISNYLIDRHAQFYVYAIVSLLLFFISIFFIILLWRTKTRFVSYFLKGSTFAISGAFIANILLFFNNRSGQFGYVHFTNSVAPFIGILFEVYYFTSGLSFKTKLIENEKNDDKNKLLDELLKNQKLRKEKEEIKDRIAQDLHDDVGATLSSMQLYGELANNLWDKNPAQSREILNKIISQSKELITRMSDIIWSLKPINETHSLDIMLKDYSVELLAPKNIICHFNIDENIYQYIENADTRKNILLIVKEAMNNIAKYSEAKNATISFFKNNNSIIFSIKDDGKGFDLANYIPGNGINNIKKRTNALNATISITSIIGEGTSIVFEVPL